MTSVYQRHPVETISLTLYSAYCVVALYAIFVQGFLHVGALIWPYPFLLTIGSVVPSLGSAWLWLSACALGFVVIAAVAHSLSRAVSDREQLRRVAPLLAAVAIVAALGGLTLTGYTLATLRGWPVGE